jgi:Ricin-type beta-trefoil lectin domain
VSSPTSVHLVGVFAALLTALAHGCTSAKMATISNGNSKQCIKMPRAGYPTAETPVRLTQCDPHKNRQWNTADGAISGPGTICVSVDGNATADGTPVLYSACRSAPGQIWTVQPYGRIVGIGGKCLDVKGGAAISWAPLIISQCSDAPTQKWLLQP